MPALRCLFRAQNGFKLFALFSLESLDSSRFPSPYQPESVTANNSNKLQTWQDHDVRNLITSTQAKFATKWNNFFPLRNSRKFTPKFPDFFSKWKAPEEPLGTQSYRTSSKRSESFWLLIGATKPLFFCAQSESSKTRSRFVCSYTD